MSRSGFSANRDAFIIYFSGRLLNYKVCIIEMELCVIHMQHVINGTFFFLLFVLFQLFLWPVNSCQLCNRRNIVDGAASQTRTSSAVLCGTLEH